MLCLASTCSRVAIFEVVIHRAILTRGFAQVLNFTQYSSAVGGEKFFCDANKADDAAVGRNPEGVGQKPLDQGGVAFIGRGLDLGWKGGEGEDVSGVKGAGVEETGGVGKGDEY